MGINLFCAENKSEYSNPSNSSNLSNQLQKNLKFLIKKYNLDNDSLAKITGLTSYTIASLRARSTNPTLLTLKPLAEFFNLTIDQLVYDNCEIIDESNKNNNLNLDNINIPIININDLNSRVVNIYNNENNNVIDYIVTSGNINNNSYALRLDSEVLMPSYQKNTVLIVDPSKVPQDSNIVVISIDNNQPTYRQVFIDSGEFYFKPINPDFGGMAIIKNYKIYGVVIRAIFDVE